MYVLYEKQFGDHSNTSNSLFWCPYEWINPYIWWKYWYLWFESKVLYGSDINIFCQTTRCLSIMAICTSTTFVSASRPSAGLPWWPGVALFKWWYCDYIITKLPLTSMLWPSHIYSNEWRWKLWCFHIYCKQNENGKVIVFVQAGKTTNCAVVWNVNAPLTTYLLSIERADWSK